MPHSAPPVHLIIRLPYNRPETPVNDPPLIEWNSDKENMLWEVIARSRATDSGGTDWQGLSAHLQVPLPYLLYRAQVRYEEDLRGIQDIRGTLNTSNSLATRHSEGGRQEDRLTSAHPPPPRGVSRMASSIHRRTPVYTNQRPVSQPNFPNRLLRGQGSASTLALSHRRGATPHEPPPRASSPASSHTSMSPDEADKAEEEERRQEEQEAVGRRLKELEKMMSSDMLGFAHAPRTRPTPGPSTTGPRSPLKEAVPRDDSVSESTSTSPHGSIPSIPSPEPQSQSSSQALSATQAPTTPTSPSLVSPRSNRLQLPPRLGVAVHGRGSRRGSSHGSSASSFSDISDAASVSASALESALMSNMSNIRGQGSRLSIFARSHFGGGRGVGH